MIQVLETNKVDKKHPITFPVRASMAINSKDQLKDLLAKAEKTHKSTLSVWTSDADKVDAKQLEEFIKEIGLSKVYVDVPESLLSQMNLNGASSLVQFGLLNMVAMGFALFFRNGLH